MYNIILQIQVKIKNMSTPCLSCENTTTSLGIGIITPKIIPTSSFDRMKSSLISYCDYSKLSPSKGKGNQIKQGSGGNSYEAYLLRKRGNVLMCNN